MNSLARCDFMAKSSDCPKLLDGDRIKTREKRNACAAFTSVPMVQTQRNYMPVASGPSSRKSLARSPSPSGLFARAPSPDFLAEGQTASLAGTKNKKAQAVILRPKKNTGHAPSRAPSVSGFSKSERQADSQAELPLIE